jgi:hypothetical protein
VTSKQNYLYQKSTRQKVPFSYEITKRDCKALASKPYSNPPKLAPKVGVRCRLFLNRRLALAYALGRRLS